MAHAYHGTAIVERQDISVNVGVQRNHISPVQAAVAQRLSPLYSKPSLGAMLWCNAEFLNRQHEMLALESQQPIGCDDDTAGEPPRVVPSPRCSLHGEVPLVEVSSTAYLLRIDRRSGGGFCRILGPWVLGVVLGVVLAVFR